MSTHALRLALTAQRIPPMKERLKQLLDLRASILNHEATVVAAMKTDLGKSFSESWIEVGGVLSEIDLMVKEAPAWAIAEQVATPMVLWPGKSSILKDPYGLVLVLSPWNYPFQLSLKPLIGAIAAGNRVVLKPSEMTPTVAKVLETIVTESISEDFALVVQGGAAETQELLKEKFDFIFFTGSTHVGQVVMKAAAEHLTPVVLELGGKSPCIVDETADLKVAAHRIMWGKFTNAGQTCVAPDYVMVQSSVKERFLKECATALQGFYGENPGVSPDLGRIVNEKNFDRLQGLLSASKPLLGGQSDRAQKFIAPTIVDNVTWDHPLMKEEIFGPILPVMSFEQADSLVEVLNQKPKPLAFYLFSSNAERQQHFMENVAFGGGCVNDTVVHLGNKNLPFGGVGPSGMGAYQGKFSFDTFTHRKAVYQQTTLVDPPVRYPPYGKKEKLLKFLLG